MKVTYRWLKDFVDIRLSPVKLADKLTMAGLEVVGLEKKDGDFVLEIEITSNRPDWLSIIGVAREVSAITGAKLKKLKLQSALASACAGGSWPLAVTVANKQDCPFYSARIISNLKVKPSPSWLVKRLEALGCRPVNNVVDITNYYLFELGHPLHAFDLDKLCQKSILVRRAKVDEKIITLDGQTRVLSPETLVIADLQQAIAIAGIMGGQQTEVTDKTCNILLESAVFNPVLIRRAKQKLGISSESAYRFERGVNCQAALQASAAAQELIVKLACGRSAGSRSFGKINILPTVIQLDLVYLNKTLGTDISRHCVKQILSRLGCQVKMKSKNLLTVQAPSFRPDLKLPVDLVEEVARIHGYSEIPQTIPAIKPKREILDQRDIVGNIKNILSGLGLDEAITYSLVDRELLEKSGLVLPADPVEILNPLSKEQAVLRPALLPSLMRVLAHNLDHQQDQISIFEIANVFSGRLKTVCEELRLGIALCGTKSSFTQQGLVRDEITLLHLKGIIETLLARLGFKNLDWSPQPDNKINIIIDQQPIGFMLDINPQVTSAFDIKNRRVFLAQINLDQLFKIIDLKKRFSELPKYPGITRDISFVINENILVQELLRAIEGKGAPLLSQARIVDYYQGKQIPAGSRGLTVSCVYRLAERTLTEEEVAPVHNNICSLLKERFGLTLR